jgi:hypothetical protein
VSAPVAIVSPRFDLSWFVAPGIVSAVLGMAIGLFGGEPRDTGPLLWLVAVLAIDVAHVWATLYRTYLDPQARRLHRRRLLVVPLLVAWLGFLLHLESPTAFWSVLAYVAIFHFVKQHLGFAVLYVRKAGESQLDRRLTAAAVWAGTAAPVVWWHANLPRSFAWFAEGDLITGLPAWLGTLALVLELPVLLAFVVRRAQLRRAGGHNPMVAALVLLPALNWHLGIVVFDDDRIFTLTNVIMHGVPYLALVWLAGARTRVRELLVPRAVLGPLALLACYLLGLLALAFVEETLWDRLIWHERPSLFGAGYGWALEHPVVTAAVVAVLTVPQATHYLLDRWIWRVGPSNPELAGQLGIGRAGG